MSTIATLLEGSKHFEAELDAADLDLLEGLIFERMREDTALSLRDAVTQLAIEEGVAPADLWEGMVDLWQGASGEQPLEEAIGDRFRRGARKAGRAVRRASRKAKNRYDRAKNSRAGRAVRRASRRARHSVTGSMAGSAALSIVGL